MGELLAISCTGCGYEDEVATGFGMAGVGVSPRACTNCRRVVCVETASVGGDVDLDGRPVTPGVCCECGTVCPDAWLPDEDANTEELATGGPCPRCGRDPMAVESCGLWD